MNDLGKATRRLQYPDNRPEDESAYDQPWKNFEFWINCMGAPLVLVEKRSLVARAANRAAGRFFGLPLEDFAGAPLALLVGSETNQLLGQIWSAAPIGVPGEPFLARAIVQEQERLLMVQVTKIIVDGEQLRLFTFLDAPPQGSIAMAGWQENIIDILNWLPFGLEIASNDEQIQFANSQFNTFFGYSQDEVENIEDWWLNVYPDPDYRAHARYKWETEVATARAENREMTPFDLVTNAADGTKRTIQFRHRTIGSFNVNLYLDVTRERADEKSLKSLAETDPLTGAVNRRRFFDEADQAYREGAPVAILMLDIDHFKQINDAYGHGVGDLVLVEFTQRCQQALRPNDLLARFGGEEFAILLHDACSDTIQAVAERLRLAVNSKLFVIQGISIAVTLSIGCARRAESDGIDTTISRADRALYRAKDLGRDRVIVSE
jgi:diguanylate cyclase (GGDEF)-like protein